MTSWLGVVVFLSTFLCLLCSKHSIGTRFAPKKDPDRWEISSLPELVTITGREKQSIKLQLKMTDHYERDKAGNGGAALTEAEKALYVELSARIKEFFVKHYSTMELMEKKVTSSDKDEVYNGWTVLTINDFRTLRFEVTAADDPDLANIFAGKLANWQTGKLIVSFTRKDVGRHQEWTMTHCGPFGPNVVNAMSTAIAAKAKEVADAIAAAKAAAAKLVDSPTQLVCIWIFILYVNGQV